MDFARAAVADEHRFGALHLSRPAPEREPAATRLRGGIEVELIHDCAFRRNNSRFERESRLRRTIWRRQRGAMGGRDASINGNGVTIPVSGVTIPVSDATTPVNDDAAPNRRAALLYRVGSPPFILDASFFPIFQEFHARFHSR
ncbi:MAG TPA: hypothetical protein VF627_11525 [Abditibacterium sp.]|jgi:hypothetical protein